MTYQMLTEIAASISSMKVVSSDNGMSIAIPNRNKLSFYYVPSSPYEAIMELLDDIELLELAKERMDEPAIKVTLDDL